MTEMFPNEGELKPRSRFKEFVDNHHWNIVQLGDVSDIIGGGTPSTSFKAFWDGDIDWYSPTEIGEKIFLNNSEKKITQLGLAKSSAKILPIGSILYTSRAGIGNTAILAKEGCTNQGFQSIVPHKSKLNSYFIYSRSKELKKYGQIKGAGSTFTEVSGKQLAQMPIALPDLSEQTKIGNFFRLLDDKIALEQKKLDKLKNIKQAYLNEMFV
ncbi:restriction endonuclease subunit S [Snodgrassella alvi]|nr:restriction endonuclease subunit S [Snodgrassella alvi]